MTEDAGAVEASRVLFDYLYLRDVESGPADAVIGFGHFDLKIPRRCLELHRRGLAPLIVFSGGRGAGSAALAQPEARAFLEVFRAQGGTEGTAVVIEDRSTNTGENIEATARLLESEGRAFGSEGGVRTALIVANAYRQRRVDLTCRLHYPDVRWINAPPVTTFDAEAELFAATGQDLLSLLCGEIRRLLDYPARGFCLPAKIPRDVRLAHRDLEAALGSLPR